MNQPVVVGRRELGRMAAQVTGDLPRWADGRQPMGQAWATRAPVPSQGAAAGWRSSRPLPRPHHKAPTKVRIDTNDSTEEGVSSSLTFRPGVDAMRPMALPMRQLTQRLAELLDHPVDRYCHQARSRSEQQIDASFLAHSAAPFSWRSLRPGDLVELAVTASGRLATEPALVRGVVRALFVSAILAAPLCPAAGMGKRCPAAGVRMSSSPRQAHPTASRERRPNGPCPLQRLGVSACRCPLIPERPNVERG